MESDYQKNTGCIDMHLHTNHGKGKYSPTEIVKASRFLGLEVIGITDRNNINGLSEAVKTGERYGIKVIPGVEILTLFQNLPICLLGYGQNLLTSNFSYDLNILTNKEEIQLENAVDLIKKYNGVTILVCSDISVEKIERTLIKGIDGLEVIHPNLDKTQQDILKKLSRRFNLLMSGGSDSKGQIESKNIRVPYSFFVRTILGIKQVPILEGIDDISELSLEEKIGLIIKPGFEWPLLDVEDKRLIQNFGVGLNKINKDRIQNLEELEFKIKKIVELSSIPPLLTINQEGGRLNTIDMSGFTLFPGNMSIGATNNKKFAYLTGRAIGKQLFNLGITWNFAPVCDVLHNTVNPSLGTRCFGSEATEVAVLASEFIRGMQEEGVAATAKHFPGLGPSNSDSHEEIPSIKKLNREDLLPFEAAINANVAAVMVANLKIIDVDPEFPAVISKKVIDILRETLKFKGVIVTENLSIPALIKEFKNLGEVAVRAFEAGADIIMIDPDFSKEKYDLRAMQKGNSNSVNKKIEVYEALLESVLSGRISEERINESIRRIWNMRERYGVKPLIQRSSMIAEKEHIELAQIVSDESLTLIKNSKDILIKPDDKILLINLVPQKLTRADSSWKITNNMFVMFQEHFSHVNYIEIKADDCETKLQYQSADYIVVSTYNLSQSNNDEINYFLHIISKLKKHRKQIVHVALGDPQDTLLGKDDIARIVIYSPHKVSIKSLCEFLSGNLKAKGQVPFTLE
ncbi:PHP domain-containing protein [Fictibacillus nanhaiensis]|uniref:beta-N-acetylhexosaminidase n=1 Tax=Fictibacillus nanhaiensis TaxID=742169 RepID=A0ABS2ZNU4_9BACL|nr:PHP domain-containing protein [Fictibacillus nanhaiensis]